MLFSQVKVEVDEQWYEFMGRIYNRELLLFIVILLSAIIMTWYIFGRKKDSEPPQQNM